MKKKIGTILIAGLILVFVYEGTAYLYKRSHNAISDAAFIKSDHLATLSFNVGGNVVSMLKKENESVRKGELLARIDRIDLQTAKEELTHRIDSLNAQIEALILQHGRLSPTLSIQTATAKNDLDASFSENAALSAQLDAARARSDKFSRDERRYAAMLENRLISPADYESAHTQAVSAQKEVEALEAKLAVLRSQYGKAQKGVDLGHLNQQQIAELDQKIIAAKEEKKALESALSDLDHKIGYTNLYAPFEGIVAKKFIEAPSTVKQGTPIYALTDPKTLYAEVLLSEKELHGVAPGNRVSLEVDAIPEKTYHGKVESIASTSASTFSLVPRDIASGEFTKLDQRFSVRIALDSIEGLRSGMGTTVVIERK